MKLARRIDDGPHGATFECGPHPLQSQAGRSASIDGNQPFHQRTRLQSPPWQQCIQRRNTRRQPRPLVRNLTDGSTTQLPQRLQSFDTMFVSWPHRPDARRIATTFPTIRRSSSGPTRIGLKR